MFKYYGLKRLLFVLLILLVSCVPVPVLEAKEDIPVEIQADHLHFDGKREIIIASGNVVATFKNIKMESDYMELDSNNDLIKGKGSVVFTKDGETLVCQSFVYNIDKEKTVFSNFKYELMPEVSGAKQKIFLHADNLVDKDEKRSGKHGTFTTCDHKKYHYHMKARKFKYYPKKYLVGYHVIFKEGRVPIFYFPIFYYDLRKRKVSMSMPVFGDNDVEGFFIKTAFDYFINPSHHGNFYLDRMSLKGWGRGVKHNFVWNDNNESSIYYYGLKERDTNKGDNIIKLKHKSVFGGNTTLTFEENFSNIYLIPSGSEHKTKTLFDIRYKERKKAASFKYNLNRNIKSRVNNSSLNFNFRKGGLNTSLSHSLSDYIRTTRRNQYINFKFGQNLGWNLKYQTNFGYKRYLATKGDIPDERLDTKINFKHTSRYYGSLDVLYSLYNDLDGDTVTKDSNINYIEKKPEVTIRFKRLRLKIFDWNNFLTITKFKESRYVSSAGQNRIFETKRYQIKTGISKTLRSKKINTTLSYGFSIDQRLYDPGDALYFFSERISLATKQLNFIKHETSWNRRFSNGNSPFFFETKGQESNTLKDKLKFFFRDEKRYFLSFDTGYNFMNYKFDHLKMELNIQPYIRYGFYRKKRLNPFHLNFKTAYDFENNKWLDFIGRIKITPHRYFDGSINFTYDLDRNELERAGSVFNFQLGWGDWKYIWNFKVRHAWDFQDKKYRFEDFIVTKDFHCQKLSVGYNRLRKEYKLTFVVKAFPGMPLGFATGKEGFQFEGFMRKEGIRRY